MGIDYVFRHPGAGADGNDVRSDGQHRAGCLPKNGLGLGAQHEFLEAETALRAENEQIDLLLFYDVRNHGPELTPWQDGFVRNAAE